MPDKNVREELAELTEAVRELRDNEVADELRSLRAEVERLRAGQGTHHCHGCSCMHVHWYQQTYPIPGCAPYIQPQIWYGTVTSSGTSDFGSAVTNAVSSGGYNPATTTFSTSN